MVTTNQKLILDALKKEIKKLILNMTLKRVIKLQRAQKKKAQKRQNNQKKIIKMARVHTYQYQYSCFNCKWTK